VDHGGGVDAVADRAVPRHLHVHHHHVRAALDHQRDDLGHRAGLPYHPEVVLEAEQCGEGVPDQPLVVGDQHADHSGHRLG